MPPVEGALQLQDEDTGFTPLQADTMRPGWSTTRGIAILDHGDHLDEYNPHAIEVDPNSEVPLDMVRKKPCERSSDKMDELTNSWMNDPDAAAVSDRLDALDKEAWASEAHTASR